MKQVHNPVRDKALCVRGIDAPARNTLVVVELIMPAGTLVH